MLTFSYLILRKISKFVATRCQIMKAKNAMHQTQFWLGLRYTDHAEGAYSALPDSLAGLGGLRLRKGREGLEPEGEGRVEEGSQYLVFYHFGLYACTKSDELTS